MSNYITRTCPICRVEYQADTKRLKHGRQTTCSRKCSYELRANKLSKLETRQCECCGENVTRVPSEFRYDKTFCGDDCMMDYRAKQAGYKTLLSYRFCLICGQQFKQNNRGNKYCSRPCFEIAHKDTMSGENNPSYIDGRSYNSTYDAGVKWHKIRKEVYKRDNYNCQKCGVKCVSKSTAMKYPDKTKLIIQCHHIVPYDVSQDNSLENLTTLCIVCHRAVHTEMDRV